ncbi:MAG: chemotaxis response regulator protein-glutamate methylesterase [Staphylothermus sp.]|nr:chemotaxis response regulator protein-glutamate methylesterase [Staphylothermus sp.]
MVRTRPIHVLVVDDSRLMRSVLKKTLERDPEIKVVGEAKNGEEAVKLVHELSPDVVIMDIVMPRMDGITAIKRIMAEKPTPILVFSSITQQGAKATIEALEAGALEVVAKPGGMPTVLNLGDLEKELVRKVRILATIGRAKLVTRLTLKRISKKKKTREELSAPVLAVLAASTGGPQTLMTVMSMVSGRIPAGYLIVQHMPPLFTKTFAERLNAISEIRIKEAEEGEEVLAGYGYVAPGGYHMVIRSRRGKLLLELDKGPKIHGVRPAADVTLKSVAEVFGEFTVATILTGMGCDGADGACLVKKHGGYVIAQDEETSIVWGMPRCVVDRGCADKVLPLYSIAYEINRVLVNKLRLRGGEVIKYV